MRQEYTRIQVGERPGRPLSRAQGRLPSKRRKSGCVQRKRPTACGRMNSTLRRIAVAFPRWLSAGVELSGILAGVSGRTSVKLGPGRGALKPATDSSGRKAKYSPGSAGGVVGEGLDKSIRGRRLGHPLVPVGGSGGQRSGGQGKTSFRCASFRAIVRRRRNLNFDLSLVPPFAFRLFSPLKKNKTIIE